MIKKNKVKFALSCLVLLLPVLLGVLMWEQLPESMATHWGADGNADGFGSKAFAVFGLPGILLVMHVVCLLVTGLDKKQMEQDTKALGILFWIMPAVSLLTNAMMYRAAVGKEFAMGLVLPAIIGLMFLFIGNYLPKIKQNKTLGIKISWTLNNEENWNRTHRFAGKLWVAGGLVILASAFLPVKAMLWVAGCITAAMIIAPMVYSYGIYRRQKAAGEYVAAQKTKADKIVGGIVGVVITLVLIGSTVLMFTGEVTVDCYETAFQIRATYWTDAQIDYAEVETVTYRKNLDPGARANGFGSARLSLGIFENEEFGDYTLYAYTGAKEFIVLTSGDKTLVIGLESPEQTQALYQTLLSKIKK